MTHKPLHYFFVGIGGSGMAPLADLVRGHGHRVSGSDRGFDQGKSPDKAKTLTDAGITLCPQDGSGVTSDVDVLVVSSAVEDTIPDVQAAKAQGVVIKKRAEVLAELFNAARGIGLAGTSGKTTTTGMTGFMLHEMGQGPTIFNGGIMPDFVGHPNSLMGNAVAGSGDLFAAEMDESDGSIALYQPAVAVLNNITLDHKPIAELEPLFHDFLTRARDGAVVNLDDTHAAAMAGVNPNTVTVGIDNDAAMIVARNVTPTAGGVAFDVHSDGAAYHCNMKVPGRHNVSNALAALGVARALGLDFANAVAALSKFSGIRRRMEVLGTENGVTVIDDFGHNPDKIAASLATLADHPGRVIVMFQPHGFGPMKMMRDGIVSAFAAGTRDGDVVIMPEIFYAGGTVNRNISSADLIGDMVGRGVDARFCNNRDDAGALMLSLAKPGDRLVIMGARDDTLTDFGCGLLKALRPAPKAANGVQP
ncbi:UDP-N-acetylmuramate--L-alanine ligase [Micavibrio aeruginosavorus]|uniref:Mur ligase family, glutamate ligase domain protein n=1 Tax=Micavibrio aeruginosavorus (strain ARL-13) TaxID=856793 RepID=G2KM39_MICAA|nr:Mur ligase family protein [Micavibrio aeruginosavorus]AEP09735.1 mur ligase family, glutamate ligase domain protein [Micavibrio aeruginosavorus ARL-13]